MGSQSNSLILLVVIVSIIAIYVGMRAFKSGTVEQTRDEIRSELAYLSKEAVTFYHRPLYLGGGGRSFQQFNGVKKLKISTKKKRPIKGVRLWESEAAVYSVLAAAADSVIIEGTGDDVGNDGVNPIRLRCIVKESEYYTTMVN